MFWEFNLDLWSKYYVEETFTGVNLWRDGHGMIPIFGF